jgi:hypothetical protein
MIKLVMLVAAVLLLTFCGEETPQAPVDDDPGGGGETGPDTIPPSAIENLILRYTTQQSVSLVWDAPGDDGDEGTASEYDIRFSPDSLNEDGWDAATQFDGEPAPKPAGDPETVRITGLLSLTTYFFGIKTRDEAGNESDLSEVESTTTLTETQPPSAITDLVAEAVDSDTYKLTWTAPGDDGIYGQASQYTIRYSANPITPGNWSRATLAPSPPAPKPYGEIEVFEFDGPSGNVNYHFAVKAADEVGNTSELSNVAWAIGADVELYITPNPSYPGDEVTVYWRSPGDQFVSVHVWRYYSVLYECEVYGQHAWLYADLFVGLRRPAGLYMTTFDFKFPNGDYFPTGWYTIEMCWGNSMHTTAQARFVND